MSDERTHGSSNSSQAIFATLLRQSENFPNYSSNKASQLKIKKKDFDLVFSKVKRSLYEEKHGVNFLPPINNTSTRNIKKLPVLKVNRDDSGSKVHSFEPSNMSMPKYEDKYRNEKNAAAVRHLLGGKIDALENPSSKVDIRSSHIHW